MGRGYSDRGAMPPLHSAPAVFHDGASSSDQAVRVRVDGQNLVIADIAGQDIVRWPLEAIMIAGGSVVGGNLRLRRKDDDLARLSIRDRAFVAALDRMLPHLEEEQVFDFGRLRFVFGLMLTMGGAVGVVFFLLLPLFSHILARTIPETWETSVGERIQTVMVRNFGQDDLECTGAVGREALDKIIARLEPHANSPYPITVTVLDVDTVNAFALPGGRIVVARGLFNFAQSGDEVAAVIAHEMRHVSARHPSRNVIEGGATALLLNLLFGGVRDKPLEFIIGNMLITARHSRERELDADRGAVELMERAGLDPRALATFLERIARSGRADEAVFSWLLTHPVSAHRARHVRDLAQVPDGTPIPPVLSRSEFMRLRFMCTQAQKRPQERMLRKRHDGSEL